MRSTKKAKIKGQFTPSPESAQAINKVTSWTSAKFRLSKAITDWDQMSKLDLPDRQKEKLQKFRTLLKELKAKLKDFD
jgi:hypothetical protein